MRQAFVIWFGQRSGSTHLVSLLDSHPLGACFPEIFFTGEGGVPFDYFQRSSCLTVDAFLTRFFAYNWGPAGADLPYGSYQRKPAAAVGFKLKYTQVNTYPEVFQYIHDRRTEIRVIHLIRKNVLARLVSCTALKQVLQRFGKANIMRSSLEDRIEVATWLDPVTLVDDLRRLENEAEFGRRLVEPLVTKEVYYEDLVERPYHALAEVQDFVGLPVRGGLYSGFRKILPTDLEQCVVNFATVKAVLSGSEYETFLGG